MSEVSHSPFAVRALNGYGLNCEDLRAHLVNVTPPPFCCHSLRKMKSSQKSTKASAKQKL